MVFEIFVIAGLIRNRPITESLIEWFRPGWVAHHITNHAWSEKDARAYHSTHMRLTLALGTDAVVLAILLGGIEYFLRRRRTVPQPPSALHGCASRSTRGG
ncbi:hypothetical protein MHAE_08013 [Mycobacterium haemophilum DSM 44634]|uniref:hypothetical protein n=1 Tax=Mycobacterium haemophilum TaxID=29311 RepID=UPI0006566510|nr:hypothetical protein [Mycobacterium haemophilum]AKN15763.1 hypothetical protein B586_02985 [Mycobacterium haemophilum DSM 44634]MCV7341138.1 hypothetical protein [Mycobacterium haemophilum DSM 44634]